MRYAALDGLRGLAALLVVLSHFSNRTGIWGGRLGHGGGQIGVMLFFLISGFLMARLYLGEEPTTRSLARFAQRRIARVVPLYIFVVLVSFATVSMFGTDTGMYPITADNLSEHVFFLRGVGVLWSIPVEIQFYLLFVIIWVATGYVRGFMLFAAALAAIAILCIFIPETSEEHPNGLFYYLHFFLAGTVIAVAHGAGVIRQTKWWSVAFCMLAFAPLLMMPRIGLKLFGWSLELWESPLTLLILALLLISALVSSLADKVLGGAVGRFCGDISYSVYLVHIPILFWITLVSPPISTAMFLLTFLIIVALVSWMTYRLIERPSRRIINAVGHREPKTVLRAA
jgi:peptidoglycan/LPS O-acetylase OafA/YrhL